MVLRSLRVFARRAGRVKPDLGHAVVGGLAVAVAGRNRVALDVAAQPRQFGHDPGMLRAPVLPEVIEVHAGLALDKGDRLDHESMPPSGSGAPCAGQPAARATNLDIEYLAHLRQQPARA